MENLKKLLQKDERLVSEGELLKNTIIQLAIKLDKDLIKLLLSDKNIKEVFFSDVGGAMIFDKDKFVRFISNKQFLPDSYTAFKIQVGLTEGDEYIKAKNDVVLSWPYKDCVLEGGMTKEDQKRDEIFWNETLAPDEISRLLDPKVFTNTKRIDAKGEHKFDKFKTDDNGDIKDNLIIKGNNLLALHSLKTRFAGKVKLIYIDPPYNRDADIFYNDTFRHSSWLTFMKNRLESAWDLLDEHGIITISLDDNENHYLKVLLDEIFKPENFIGNLVRQTRKGGGSMSKFISVDHDYILVYAKKKKNLDRIYTKHTEEYLKRYNEIDETGRFFWDTYVRNRQGTANFYEIKAPDGSKLKNAWLNPEKTFKKLINDGEVRFVKKDDGSWSVQVKQRLNKEGQILRSLITDFPNEQGTSEIKEIFNSLSFSYPKPKNLIKKLIEIFSDSNDVVLDFFAGSGTTGHAVLELNKEDGGNRKFILIEQLDEHINVCKKRISAVGGDFAYLELASWNEKWIENIKKAKTGKELEKIWDELKKSAFLSYKIEPEKVDKYKKEFSELSLAQQKDFLQKECLDQNHLYINYSEINDEEYKVSAEDKKINKEFYGK